MIEFQDKTVPLLTAAQGYHLFEDVTANTALPTCKDLLETRLLINSKMLIQNSTNVMCDLTKEKGRSLDTVPGKSTLVFHPHSSWHPRYQILHSNLGQKTELPTVFLQKTHIHLQPPLETKAEVLLWAASS